MSGAPTHFCEECDRLFSRYARAVERHKFRLAQYFLVVYDAHRQAMKHRGGNAP